MNTVLTQNITTQFALASNIDVLKADPSIQCLIVPVYKNNILSPTATQLNQISQGHINRVLESSNFEGKLKQIEIIYHLPGITNTAVMLVGCGESDQFTVNVLEKISYVVSERLKQCRLTSAVSLLDHDMDGGVQRFVMGITDKLYQFNHYRSVTANSPEDYQLHSMLIVSQANQQELQYGIARASGRDVTRDLANHPGNVCTPSYLAEHSRQLSDQVEKLSIEVLEEADMEALGMGAFMSVSRGSEQAGKMIILNYQGTQPDVKPIVLVGKGITFDTGGISIKPGAQMDEMKFDMGGAAGALGTLHALCAMELDINVIVVVAAAENMPSSRATKPGDIVTSLSGKTIEVLNTDAEGRLVLCDALTYIEQFEPDSVIDMATLTGACIIALGHETSALFSNTDTLAEEVLAAGLAANDTAWRLPINEQYTKQLKSEFADLGNIGGRPAGSITAACFLAEFTKSYPWVHLDIAGTAWSGKAATGRPVALLTQWLLNRAQT